MVERYKRGKGKRKLLGNHQKCWVWGRNTILETLKAGRWPIRDLWLSNQLPELQIVEARSLAESPGVPVQIVEPDVLHSKCHSHEHQGYVARMTEFCYSDSADLDSILVKSASPLLAVCDSVQDPFNFGAIVRTAEIMGVDAIVIGTSHQVGVTSLVARASAGAVNHVPIIRLNDVAQDLKSYQAGLQIVGASEKAESNLFDQNLTGPTAIIVGNEGQGISDNLLQLCHHVVRIPQTGQVESLNAAVSASIFFYEARRQRSQGGK